MTRFLFAIAAVTVSSTALAAPCEYTGNAPAYVGCIAEQSWAALELAEGTAARVAGECPDGWYTVGGSCIDPTCRGPGEGSDSDIDTYGGAEARCAELGASLCSMSQLIDSRASGCGFDNEFIAVKMAQPGDERVFRRGKFHETTGECIAADYTGEHYPDAYRELPSCQTHHIYMDADDHIDGFLCCL